MANDRKGEIVSVTDGGVSGEHAAADPFEFLVGPTTTDEFNTARLPLIAVACVRTEDNRFAFDSSFLAADLSAIKDPAKPKDAPDSARPRNDVGQELALLVERRIAHRGAPLAVFGHADPVGNDDYNKLLSGRRAMVLYALLLAHGDPRTAVELWQHVAAAEHWGADQRETMQKFTGLGSGTPDNVLFRSYMQKLCPPELKLTKKDFLGQGVDAGGKGDFQGCSEFNPILVFSQEKEADFKKAKADNNKKGIEQRNLDNAPNRRVMILLFRPGSRVDPEKWPCPRATEGVAACKNRFFSNGEERRGKHLPNKQDRKFENKNDTFACRFYQRISDRSPCEGLTADFGLLHMQVFDGEGRVLLTNRKYEIFLVGEFKPRYKGVLNDKGILRHEFVPHGDYVLKVEGCSEESPMIVLAMSNPVPTVRCLETSALTFFVTTSDGVPLDGAKVSIPDLGDKVTDLDGVADFGLVQAKQYKYSVSKDEFLAHHGESFDNPDIISQSNSATGVVAVTGKRAKPQATLNGKSGPPVVKSINAEIQGTKSLRTTPGMAKSLGPRTLPSSSSNSTTPIDPVVLVRCDLEVQLEAITDPAGQPVTWAVAQNQSSATPPSITPAAGGTKANLKLDQAGSFSASATIGGSAILWNFVVVGLDVDVAGAKITTRNTFEDLATALKTRPNPSGFGIPPDYVGVWVGEFVLGKNAWESELTVKSAGGGPSGDVGLSKVKPWYSQNLNQCEARGLYDKGAKGYNHAKEALKTLGLILDVGGPTPSGVGPVVGVTAAGPQWPVITAAGMVDVSGLDPTTKSRTVKMGDSPSTAFKVNIAVPSGQRITHIDGHEQFTAAIVSFSEDVPNVVVVHAIAYWLAYYQGHIDFPWLGDPKWVKDFANMGAVSNWKLVGAATGGLDAAKAGFEIFGPLATTVSNDPQDNTP